MGMKKNGMVYYCRKPISDEGSGHEIAMDLLKQGFRDFFQTDFREDLIKKNEYGKPYYAADPALKFNISHCRGGVAAVLSEKEVGIDAESMRRVNKRIVKKCCSREEFSYVFGGNADNQEKKDILQDAEAKRFLTLWTLKESYVKMTGEGLRVPFDRVCFLPPDLQKRKGKDVIEAEGFDSACRHYLYLAGDLMLALTVQWGDCEGEPDFGWREVQVANGMLL